MIPSLLTRNVREYWPERGDNWLAALPALLDDIIADWHLSVAEPHRMTIHWVCSVVLPDGAPGVLKLGVPDGHLDAEAEALRIFDGDGAVRLIAEDALRGAMLLERIEPGTTVGALEDDEEATAVLIKTGQRLHRVPPGDCTLPHLSSLAKHFTKYPDKGAAAGQSAAGRAPIPRKMADRAAELFADLCASSSADVVLHGDLHHENVLRGPHDWLAIDPHGFVGDAGYDAGAMLYNPHPENRNPDLLRLVPRRIEQLAEHDDLDRVVAWGYVMAVLSQLWSGDTPTRALDVARLLEPRLV